MWRIPYRRQGDPPAPGTILRGTTSVGPNCEIGPNTMLVNCTVGAGVTVNSSQCFDSTIEDGAEVGPFAYIRPNCHVSPGSRSATLWS